MIFLMNLNTFTVKLRQINAVSGRVEMRVGGGPMIYGINHPKRVYHFNIDLFHRRRLAVYILAYLVCVLFLF
jgi:hypothetical protein